MEFKTYVEEVTERMEKDYLPQVLPEGTVTQKWWNEQEAELTIGVAGESGRDVQIDIGLEDMYQNRTLLPDGLAVQSSCESIMGWLKDGMMENMRKLAGKLQHYETVKKEFFMELRSLSMPGMAEKNYPVMGVKGTDLCLVPFVRSWPSESMPSSPYAKIDTALTESWGVPADQVLRDAWQNTIDTSPSRQISVLDFLLSTGAIGIDEQQEQGPMLWAVTNDRKWFGASALLYPGVMDELGKKLGNFYILPSSCHEVLVLPELQKMEVKEMEELVQQVNRTQVKQREWLSDRVYHYDAYEKKLEFALDYEQRIKKAEMEVSLVPPAKKLGGPAL